MNGILKKIGYIFTKGQKIRLLVLLLLIMGGAIAETVGVSVIMPFISIVAVPDSIMTQPVLAYFYNLLHLQSPREFLILLALLLVFVYLAKNVYLFVLYKLQFRFVYNNQMRLSAKLMGCYLKKPYEYHMNKNSAEVIRSVTDDVSRLFLLVLHSLLLVTEVVVVICIGTFLIVIEPIMTLATLVLLGSVMSIFIVVYRRILIETGIKNQVSHGMMIKWISQGLGGIKEIKVTNREQFFIDEYAKAAAKYAESQRKHNFLMQSPRLFIEAVCISGMMIIIAVMLYSGRDISSMIPQLGAFAVAAFRIMPSFNRIAAYYNGIVFNIASIDLVYRDLKENEDTSIIEDENSKEIILTQNTQIKVDHLTYRYPNMGTDIIKDACLDIPLRKSIAIIGTSGTGKTTFADILLGLLQPTGGKVTVAGEDIHKGIREWSKNIGYIPQNIYLCDDTIKNNVAFGLCDNEINEERVWLALENAQLKDFVSGLPEALNTIIGERGIRFSGGQRQRIGIARALYNDPEILVLDEATSSLDNDTETAVMEAINAFKNEKTLIIIAHRMSTIQNCDLVVKITDGNILIIK